MSAISAPGPDRASDDTSPEARRLKMEGVLMDADRMMVQIVKLSLSLIGYGFSINAFFNDRAERGGGASFNENAKLLGLALLAIGVMYLVMGIWSQARYRLKLSQSYNASEPAGQWRAALHGRGTPTFLTAFLLLIVGLGALVSIVFRRLL